MMLLDLKINGETRRVHAKPHEILLDLLRRTGYWGVKRGCENGTCGSCTVLIDGVPHFSCLLFAEAVQKKEILTIEGLSQPGHVHPIMQAFVEEAGVQCGYCTPGMVLSTKALLDKTPFPSEQEAKEALDGHLCRCTGYVKQIKAVLKAAHRVSTEKSKEGTV